MRRILPLAFFAVLASCGGQPRDYAAICINEVGAQGEYDYYPTRGLPEVFPEQDATVAGAAKINACIQRRATEDGVI